MNGNGRPSEGDVRVQVERILASRTFGPRSALHILLSYLAGRSLAGDAGTLKEYTVGVEAFGRSEGYDPQQDPYVRVQAGKLRNKLEEFYRTEGVADPVLVELPKRKFVLEFSLKEKPAAEEAAEPPAVRRPYAPWILAGVLAVALAVVLSRWPGDRAPAAAELTPELASIWRSFLAPSRSVVISLGTHRFYRYSTGYLREPELDDVPDHVLSDRLEELRKRLGSDRFRLHFGYTGTGQATGAFLLGRFLGEQLQDVRLVRSSVLTWDDISNSNVIFLGSAKSNPQIDILPRELAFRIEEGAIVSRDQRNREVARFVTGPTAERAVLEEYSLISFIPGLHQRGDLLIIESPTTTGVWTAVKYLTEAPYARELASRLGKSPGSMPRHYQLVIRAQVRDTVPLQIEYVTHRSL